jgi:AP-1 complex subunit mu
MKLQFPYYYQHQNHNNIPHPPTHLHSLCRGDVPLKTIDRFMAKVTELEENGGVSPVIQDGPVSYIYIQYSNLYLLALARSNVNTAAILVFLHKLVEIFKHYFQELEEESLRDNFVIAYELLDEVMDYGYPQFTEAKILSEFIKTDAYRMAVQARPPMAVTNAVSWRNEGIHYKKNEVFLDVVESVNMLVNSNGAIVRSEVVGALKMRAYLSGMPECKLGLNDRVLFEAQGRASRQKAIDLEDIKFHQCVRLASFERDRTISFIPPDGSFDLMTYRLSQNVKPLIWVECQVERHSRSRTEYLVKARSQFKDRSTATSVEIQLPLPPDAISPQVRTTQGNATYAPEKEALVWKIKNFPGGREFLLRCKFGLPSVEAEEEVHGRMPPIKIKFEIPYYTISGIQVRYLKVVERSGYQALPWVRYITTAGDYELRMNT